MACLYAHRAVLQGSSGGTDATGMALPEERALSSAVDAWCAPRMGELGCGNKGMVEPWLDGTVLP